MSMTETDLERLIEAVPTSYLRRYDGLGRIMEDLRQQLTDKRRGAALAFRPGPHDGTWLIGPEGSKQVFRCSLAGMWPAYLALLYRGDGSSVVRASDFVSPDASQPANAARNAIVKAAEWAETMPRCRELAAAIRCVSVGRDGTITCRPLPDNVRLILT